MPNYSYAFRNFDKTKHVRAALREKDVSHKHAREVAIAIKGLSIEKAREFSWRISLTRKLHFHTGAITTKLHTDPISEMVFLRVDILKKAAKEYLILLDNLESNAEYKGMDLDRLKIVSAVIHKGTKLERFTPRAMGRASPKIDTLIHVELIAQEGSSE